MLDECAYAAVYRSEAARTRALAHWVHSYNHHRSHSSIGGRAPITRVTNVPGDYMYDKVHRRDVLERAWGQVRRNDGAPGIDQITIADVAERYGVDRLLDELAAELRKGGSSRSRPGGSTYPSRDGTS